MFVAERFISSVIKIHGKHPVSTDGGTWYLMACRFLRIKHRIHSPFEKSIIERTMQYIKYRTEGFDDYFPCKRKNCKQTRKEVAESIYPLSQQGDKSLSKQSHIVLSRFKGMRKHFLHRV
jgi:transposase-like protein